MELRVDLTDAVRIETEIVHHRIEVDLGVGVPGPRGPQGESGQASVAALDKQVLHMDGLAIVGSPKLRFDAGAGTLTIGAAVEGSVARIALPDVTINNEGGGAPEYNSSTNSNHLVISTGRGYAEGSGGTITFRTDGGDSFDANDPEGRHVLYDTLLLSDGVISLPQYGSGIMRVYAGGYVGSAPLVAGDLPSLLTSTARHQVAVNGVTVGTRRALNLIAGANVTIAGADVAGSERVDVTISATGGGGGGTPSGSSGQLQFNSSGAFAGTAQFTVVSGAPQIGVLAGSPGSGVVSANQFQVNVGTRIVGAYNEGDSNPGIYLGYADGPRMGFYNGTPTQNWQIDNYFGTFRWFTPGIVQMSLSATALTVPDKNLVVTGGGQSLVLGANSAFATIGYAGGGLEISPTQLLVRGSSGPGSIRLRQTESGGIRDVGIKAPSSVPASYTLTLPTAPPSAAGQALVSDTGGNLSFAAVGGGGSGDFQTVASKTPASGTYWPAGSSETTVASFSIPAGKLSADGCTSITTFRITENTGTSRNRVTFAGQTVYDTGSRSVGNNRWAQIRITAVRTSSSAARVLAEVITEASAIALPFLDVSGVNWSAAIPVALLCTGANVAGLGVHSYVTAAGSAAVTNSTGSFTESSTGRTSAVSSSTITEAQPETIG